MKANLYVATALTTVAMSAVCALASPTITFAAEGASLLAGKVLSSTNEPLAGIPVKAHRDSGAITVAVYSNANGEYAFPAWSAIAQAAAPQEHGGRHLAVGHGICRGVGLAQCRL